MSYFVKTRNWNGGRLVFKLLSASTRMGVQGCGTKDDCDWKFVLETNNAAKAWLVWAYFMALRRYSGGWTYIKRPGGHDVNQYRSIY
jgi:hypothetical protein